MTTANRISLLRIVLIPPIIACIYFYTVGHVWIRILGAALYLVAAISDGIDGYIARHYDQKTRLGAVLDPLADKLLVNLAFVFLAVSDQFETDVPMWVPALILGRDGVITSGALLMDKLRGPLRPRPRVLGKATTVLQSAAAVGILLEVPFAKHLTWTMVVVCVLSLIDYFYKGTEKVTEKAA